MKIFKEPGAAETNTEVILFHRRCEHRSTFDPSSLWFEWKFITRYFGKMRNFDYSNDPKSDEGGFERAKCT